MRWYEGDPDIPQRLRFGFGLDCVEELSFYKARTLSNTTYMAVISQDTSG